ncbi:MAG: anthranilate synthase, partial [Pseudomonadota bacterium]
LFQGIGPRFMATRYHSLTIDPASVPDTIDVLATSVDDKEIMALKVIGHPLYGVQFHPESYLSDGGGQLLANFLHAAGMKEAA